MTDIVMQEFLVGVAVGVLLGVLTWLGKLIWQWPTIKKLFNEESRRLAAQIAGTWDAQEVFSGGCGNEQNTYVMKIECSGNKVTGEHTCTAGPDKGKSFDFAGTYKDHILSFTWAPLNRTALESGTVTAKLVQDGVLEGHGVYLEPGDGKLYTSTYKARKVEPATLTVINGP